MDDVIGGIALAVCIVPLALAFYGIWVRTAARDKLKHDLEGTPGFTPTVYYVSDKAKVALALDARSQQVLVARANAEPRLIDFMNVVGVEVERVSEPPTGTMRGNQAIAAAVRTLTLVPVRLFFRGVPGASNTEVKWSRLALKILTSDRRRPVEEITF